MWPFLNPAWMCPQGLLLSQGQPGWPCGLSSALLPELGHSGLGIRASLSLRWPECRRYPERRPLEIIAGADHSLGLGMREDGQGPLGSGPQSQRASS